jgi:hypothetical protein
MTTAGTYSDFLTALGQVESGNNYEFVSSLGYLGRFQFAEQTLSAIGYGGIDAASFLHSPATQDSAITAWFGRIVSDAEQLGLAKYIGQTVGGIEITPSGLLAGAHLVGAWNLKSFLESNGQVDPQDGYGTTVANYLARFAGYDTPFSFDGVPATANAAAAAAPDTAAAAPADHAVADAAPVDAGSTVAIAGGGHAPVGGEFAFTVDRSGDTTGTSMVDYYAWSEQQGAVADLSGATAGTAYFLPGDTSAVIRIAATDIQAQAAEAFHLALSNARGAAIGVGQADGWIDP